MLSRFLHGFPFLLLIWVIPAVSEEEASLFIYKQKSAHHLGSFLTSARFHPTLPMFVTAGGFVAPFPDARDHGNVAFWNLDRSRPVIAVHKLHDAIIQGIEFSHDGTRIATTSWDNVCKVSDWQDGNLVSSWNIDNNFQFHAEFTDNDTHLISYNFDYMELHNVNTGELSKRIPYERAPVLRFDPGQIKVGFMEGFLEKYFLLYPATRAVFSYRNRFDIDKEHDLVVTASAPEIGYSDKVYVKAFSLSTGSLLAEGPVHDLFVTRTCISPDGRYILSAGDDGASLWEWSTGRMARVATESECVDVAFHPQNQQILVCEYEGSWSIWGFGKSEFVGNPDYHNLQLTN